MNFERLALFLISLSGLTICMVYIIEDDYYLSAIQTIRDKVKHKVKNDFITILNTEWRATGAGLVSCNDTKLMPDGTFPLTALASYPGSGNTWMRHLIETSTGYATGDVYGSNILANAGFIGGKVPTFSGRTLTIKSHYFHPKMDSAILIVRNPYRAMVAEFNRQKSNKTGFAKDGVFKTEGWSNFVKNQAPKWFNLYEKYISECNHLGHTCKSMLIVYYEQLQLHLKDELRRILNYLNVTIDEQRLACTVRNSEGQFHRSKLNKTLDPFSQDLEWRIKNRIDSIHDWYEIPEACLKYWPGGATGLDKEGHVVRISPLGNVDPKGLLYSVKAGDIIKTNISILERLQNEQKVISRKLGRHIEGVTFIVDLNT